jgi:hypothetical protein
MWEMLLSLSRINRWRRAFEKVIADGKRKREKMQSWLLAAVSIITFLITLLVATLKLLDLTSA